MKVIGVIPARFKSSRFEGKPLADICGKPMIWWVYNQAIKVTEFDSVYVATDDSRIEEACIKYGLNYIMTSEKCPTGSDRVAEASQKIDGDVFINIQGDEPLIHPEMIRQVIRIFDDPEVQFGTLKTMITDEEEQKMSSTVKVVTDVNGYALYFSRSVIPSNIKDGALCPVYRHVGIYGYTKDFLGKFLSMPQSPLELGEGIEPLRAMENGYRVKVAETNYSSIGVDYPEHIAMVEKCIRERGITNE